MLNDIVEGIFQTVLTFLKFLFFNLILTTICRYLGERSLRFVSAGSYPPEEKSRGIFWVIDIVGLVILVVVFIMLVLISDVIRFGL